MKWLKRYFEKRGEIEPKPLESEIPLGTVIDIMRSGRFFQPIMELTLNSGHRVSAKHVLVSTTYAGLLEGVPSDSMNEFFLQDIPSRYQRTFGELPVYVIPPVVEQRIEPHPIPGTKWLALMPPFEVGAAFECFERIAPNNGTSSGLIVVWHQNEPALALSDDVRARIAAIDWASHAKDFWH